MTRTLTVDGKDAEICLDLSAADRWHVLVVHRGRPVARVDMASPGESLSGALLSAAVLRWADWAIARDELAERLRVRMELPQAPCAIERLCCSVVVCTRRRPDDLARLLDSFAGLDPSPHEVIVVDNDPGEQDCRSIVTAAGARSVREEQRGLNNARNAGVREARGDLVAFVDDDCVVSPGWLAQLPKEFANPSVGAVTGPAFPYLLDTQSRRRMERQASLARGLERIEFDWTTFRVTGAGAIGVGANMIFRRTALSALGPQPFPPELDAGTVTESGGDTYVIARLLARGQRVVYEPATFIYHCHRADARALHRAFYGYGIGLGAALARLLVEDREMSAPATWMWLIAQYWRTQQRRLAGRADRVETRLAWDFLRGGVLGPARWRRALREASAQAIRTAHRDASLPSSPSVLDGEALVNGSSPSVVQRDVSEKGSSEPSGLPEISVIVPTHERPEALARCLEALCRQDLAADRFEVVIVDDSARVQASIGEPYERCLSLRVIRTGGRGAAEARNAGAGVARAPILLFLDDDILALPDLVRRHLERHAREQDEKIVVGAYPPRPVTGSLISAAAALWWNDLFQTMQRTAAPTYVGVLTGNMSVSKQAFERSERFDARFGAYRREDWEWGLRALKAGLSLCYEPKARGHHEYVLSTATRLRAAELEGHGDAVLLQEHPDAGSAVIPLIVDAPTDNGLKRLLKRAAWRHSPTRTGVRALLSLLEWANLRLLWVRLFNAAQWLSYEQGVQSGGMSLEESISEPLIDLDLEGAEAVSSPAVAAPTLRVRLGGREIARVRPRLGLWTSDVAGQIASEIPGAAMERAAALVGCFPTRDETHGHAQQTQVVFGPAHRKDDMADRAQLAMAGARVDVIDEGPVADHWQQVTEIARQGDSTFVALTMPGVRPDRRWLEEALVAFEGSRVGAVLGRGLADDMSPAPLVLHSRSASGEDPRLDAVLAPHYVILRRELLPALALGATRYGVSGPVLALTDDALEGGWVLAYRDVHGLYGGGRPGFEGASTRTALRMRRSQTPFATAGAALRHSTVLVAWHFIRRQDRRMAAEIYAGTLTGLCSALVSRACRASAG